MPTATIADTVVSVDSEGFLEDPGVWTPEIAVEIAKANGIDALTDRHWQVVNFMRTTYLETGTAPSIQRNSSVSPSTKRTARLKRHGYCPEASRCPGKQHIDGNERRLIIGKRLA